MKYVAHCAACLANFEHHHEMRAHIEECARHPLAAALASNRALSEAIRREVDGCFCDDGDGNCNVLLPNCERCERLNAVLATHGAVPTSAETPPPPRPL